MKILSPGGKLHLLKNLWLRWKNGAGCCDVYSLYAYQGKRIARELTVFYDKVGGFPAPFESLEEWKKCIAEMIFGFEFYSTDLEYVDIESEEKDRERAVQGLRLYATYFPSLWY